MSFIKILSYNVAGISNKLDVSEFFEGINSFDIFCLFETFIEDKFEVYEEFLQNFNIKWIKATRCNRMGRAKGGMLIGFRKVLQSVISFSTLSETDVFKVTDSDKSLYILPVYLNCSQWDTDFNSLYEALACCNQLNEFIVLGDLNARTGCEQSILFLSIV